MSDFLPPQPSRDILAVERAIAELRLGRPVILMGTPSQLVHPVDTLPAKSMSAYGAETKLVLTQERLAYLGIHAQQDAALSAEGLSAQDLRGFAYDASLPSTLSSLPVDATIAVALKLMRQSGFAPAALMAPISAESMRSSVYLAISSEQITAYEHHTQKDLVITARSIVPLQGSDAEFIVFRGGGFLKDQVAVVIGAPDMSKPVLVRLHSACFTGDLFGSLKCDCGDQLRFAIRHMQEQGGGVLVYLDQEGRSHGIANKMRAYRMQNEGMDTFEADNALGLGTDQRQFTLAASILQQLGVTKILLMTNNPIKTDALLKAGFDVTSQPLMGRITAQNVRYLETKRDKARHEIVVDADIHSAHKS